MPSVADPKACLIRLVKKMQNNGGMGVGGQNAPLCYSAVDVKWHQFRAIVHELG